MKTTSLLEPASHNSCVIGTGLIALDVVIGGTDRGGQENSGLWAGGTCGNVLAILSYLGWKAVAVSRMSNDPASRHVRSDLQKWGVDLSLASLRPTCDTPIIVQEIRRDAIGQPFHRFSFTCPGCGAQLPRFKPVFTSSASKIVDQVPHFAVLFLDRVSRAGLYLAKLAQRKGAVVVFEPSGVGELTLFRKILRLSHIFKYSHQRFRHLNLTPAKYPQLEIETLGRGGLRYRADLPSCKTDWRLLDACTVEDFRDSAGAGDWCTAGILHALAQCGLDSLRGINPSRLHKALSFGQALAAWNCRFEGARGGMYAVEKSKLKKEIAKIMSGTALKIPVADRATDDVKQVFATICSSCSDRPRQVQSRPEIARRRSA